VRASLQKLGSDGGPIRLLRSGPHLFVNRQRIAPRADQRFAVQTFAAEWERLGVGGFAFHPEITLEQVEAFLDLYPRLLRAAGGGGNGPVLSEAVSGTEISPGVQLLRLEEDGPEPDEDPAAGARRAFFLALAGARKIVRHLTVHRVPELRISRAVVHELIDTLVAEEFSLLGLSAIQDFDRYTFQHSVHVSVLALALGQTVGLPRRSLADLGVAALLHDLGKVRIPKAVLQKSAPFDAQDWNVIRSHPLLGARELVRGERLNELAATVMLVSTEHHLRFDGTGYPDLGPDWRQGLFARIVSIADCFDAMTAARSYVRRPKTPDAVILEMLRCSGTAFDPDLLRLFVGKVGFYPVGSVLRLANGELALVAEPPRSSAELEAPRVRLLLQGTEGWGVGEERRLADRSLPEPSRRIQATCHPMDLELDVDGLLNRFYFPPVPGGPAPSSRETSEDAKA
jgi:HD-GYP domain-containing protein (c-di-GMP phosphodiesterase class II)